MGEVKSGLNTWPPEAKKEDGRLPEVKQGNLERFQKFQKGSKVSRIPTQLGTDLPKTFGDDMEGQFFV